MKKPRILLLGKSGQVGWELRRSLAPLGEVLAPGRDQVDLKDLSGVSRMMKELRPSLLVNAAAYTDVDRAESEPEQAHLINGQAVGELADLARRFKAWFIHCSTDYVFDGSQRVPYLETDEPRPLNVYGQSKLNGERAVQAVGGRFLIFRLSWVYSSRRRNFLLAILRQARERSAIRVAHDQMGTPTWARSVADTLAILTRRILGASIPEGCSGLYHLACSGQASRHDFATRIVEGMSQEEGPGRAIAAIPSAALSLPAQRPPYSVLDCGRAERVFGLRLPHWEESLRLALADLRPPVRPERASRK